MNFMSEIGKKIVRQGSQNSVAVSNFFRQIENLGFIFLIFLIEILKKISKSTKKSTTEN